MVRTVPREFDWAALPLGHQSPEDPHDTIIVGPNGKPGRCTCVADAKALAEHPENQPKTLREEANRAPGKSTSAYGVGAPGSKPRVPGPAKRLSPPAPRAPGPATRRDPVKSKAKPKSKGKAAPKKQS
ncbi:hypothetical protein LCGC14_0860370 [marine sediment metagenome]|uniref:Uncharacterized protein n=1 Tax=marine sediment metagenome TaxID=412755 RepID=A0A0F9PCL1_9ZZZZ